MKAGWGKIPFDKSIEKVKYTTKIATCDYCEEGRYPIISQESEYINGYWNNAEDVFKISKPVVIFGEHTIIFKYIDFDFVLGADGVKILQPIDDINAKFFKFYLEFCDIPSLGYSRHYKLLKELEIPIPPLSEQEQIVSELDLISGVIEKKKQQLKELDSLAQSVFYEMFGNPVENEKGWETRMWNDVFITRTGKLNANAMVENGKYPFFTCSKDIFYIDDYAFDCEALLLSGNNATANYDVKYYNGKFNAYQRTYVLTLKDVNVYQFFKFSLENKLTILQHQSIGGMTKYLTLGILNTISFVIPPLPLQQEFASKIEKIDKQKELIKQSLKDTETLFDSRMDYYFN